MDENIFLCDERVIRQVFNVGANYGMVENGWNELNTDLLRDMLSGFRELYELSEDNRAYKAVINWLHIYLNIQYTMVDNPRRPYFEKTVLYAVPYIIGFLKPQQVDNLRAAYKLLKLTYKLISNIETSTLIQLTSDEMGIISRLWRFVIANEECNARTMALKIITKLIHGMPVEKQKSGDFLHVFCPRSTLFKCAKRAKHI